MFFDMYMSKPQYYLQLFPYFALIELCEDSYMFQALEPDLHQQIVSMGYDIVLLLHYACSLLENISAKGRKYHFNNKPSHSFYK